MEQYPSTSGVAGTRITVLTNSFAITRLPTKTFYHYDDAVITKLDYRNSGENGQPERKIVDLGKRYMDVMSKLQDNFPDIFDPRPAYDGVKNMFMSRKIDNATYPVSMTGDPKKGAYEIKIVLVNEISPQLLHELIRAGGAFLDTTVLRRARDIINTVLNPNAAALTMLQVIVIQEPHIRHKFSMHSKAFYFQEGAKQLAGGLQALSGIFQSVRPVLGKFIINVDTTTAAFYQQGWLIDLAQAFLSERARVSDVRDVPRLIQDRAHFAALRSFLRGLEVWVVPAGPTNTRRSPPLDQQRKKVTIRDIVAKAGPRNFMKGHRQMTIREYWQETYNSGLLYPDMFGISKEPITPGGSAAIYPAEKCWVPPGQRYSRKLSPANTAMFVKQAVMKPPKRLATINGYAGGHELDYRGSHQMINAGIEVATRPLSINGRGLQARKILFDSDSGLQTVHEGKWNVVRRKFFQPGDVTPWWAVVVFDSPVGNRTHETFAKAMYDHMVALGMDVPPVQPFFCVGNPLNPEKSLDDCVINANAAKNKNTENKDTENKKPVVPPSFVLVYLPAEGEAIRARVKHWGDVIRGVPTQCVRAGKYDRQIGNGLDQYCNNVALKINPKLRGINCIVESDSMAVLQSVPTMVIGCDISHPSPGVQNRPSIASLVASYDSTFTTYSAHVRCQAPRVEIIQELGEMLRDAMVVFKLKMGGWPERLVIYRDGVSEGEYRSVIVDELRQVNDILKEKFADKPPEVVFIVVGKRHHVRFFPADPSQADRSQNCRPGLVVDTDIVHSAFPDFYLLSHAGILGTSRPSHYIVLRNDPRWSPDNLQAISYDLCHVYAPSTRSVSIPAPVYYADKLCTHAKYLFTPEDGLNYDDSSVGGDDEFDLAHWVKRLRPALLANRMYFI